MNGHAADASSAATRMAIENLHKAPPGLGAGVAAAAAAVGAASPAMGVHEEYLAQQQQPAAASPAAASGGSGSGGGIGGGGGGAGGGASNPPFNSVEELLAKAGQLHLLPNFQAQEFDVNAIALMQQQDFAEIGVRDLSWLTFFGPFPCFPRSATGRLDAFV